MSVFAALYSGVSGLQTYGSALGILSDNITNINTVGYKESRANFTTLVTETSSATGVSPGGVGLVPQTLVSKQGLLQASNSPTDLAIDGAGFFVVRSGATVADPDGETLFTRAGSFHPNSDGLLVNTAGNFLMGWPIDKNGNIPDNKSDTGVLQPIRTSNLTGTAEATTNVSLRANLQSSQAIAASAATYDPTVAGTNMASGTVTPDFIRTIEIFDDQGGTHTVAIAFQKDNTATNTWNVEVYADPASEVTVGAPLINGQLATGQLKFNSDGSLDLTNTSAALKNAIPITWAAANGTQPSAGSVTIDFGSNGATDGFTQYDSISALISSSVNGAVFGNVTGVSISKAGVVTALFDNGLSRDVYKLPVATFQNADGLTKRQGNTYVRSDDSGIFSMVEAGTSGAGAIAPSRLEASTVDLANEFTQLITTQRAFTASSKIISTADEMLDELNRVKR